MTDPFIGEIRIFAGNFAIQGWAFCSGQVLNIAQNTADRIWAVARWVRASDNEFACAELPARIESDEQLLSGLLSRYVAHLQAEGLDVKVEGGVYD